MLSPAARLKTFFLTFAASLITLSVTASEFPYKAIVQAPSTEVKVQPNPNAVGTMSLKQGTEVIVQRHDAGGMHRILPPNGSFSLVQADLIELNPNSNQGFVRQNKTRAFIGTTLDPNSPQTRFSIPLSKNDEVTVLGQLTLNTAEGEVLMYQIAPPSYTYSWVSGRDLVPADQYQPQGGSGLVKVGYEDDNPFGSFGQKEQVVKPQVTPPKPKVAQKKSNTKGVRSNLVNPTQLRANREALKKLDKQFKEMVQLDPRDWTLDQLRADYQQLQQNAVHKAIASQVDLRLAAVSRYEKTKAEYDSFIALTSGTTAREEELKAQQQGLETAVYSAPANETETMISSAPGVPADSGFQSVGQVIKSRSEIPSTEGTIVSTAPNSIGPSIPVGEGGVPIPEDQLQNGLVVGPRLQVPNLDNTQGPRLLGPTIPGTVASTPPPAPPVNQLAASPRFDGKGIIRRSVSRQPNMPAHVLVDQQGKILAYLQPNGQLDLNKYVGQPMGIQGEVQFRPDLKRHVLMIDRMRPITLTR